MSTLADLERAADRIRQIGDDIGYSAGACLREQAAIIAAYIIGKRAQKSVYNKTQAAKENANG